ncbi:ATP-binding cassette domain-containing protein [Thalassotalea sp. PS06]|uniref:ATP-binding cassette domain-containing protein n=1 Tax=Thalassotalea sp. PS06 TaxID=2594005 RepID=UPI001162AF70|nr:ATP-binding cassette domain-containing protein [Thalassotalea sp. PS06]QDP01911.1 ATP-binding cassette domain-containing protein [Thalassotalea sp. PS06]
MLDVRHLTRSYGSFITVDDVSFSIKKGEIIGLLGHNGAGKTTIMKIVSGYLEADDGDVSLDGISLGKNAELLQQHLGYLPESLPLYPDMTVAEHLDYAADLKGFNGKQKNSRNSIRGLGNLSLHKHVILNLFYIAYSEDIS